jgi:hypothetical protein
VALKVPHYPQSTGDWEPGECIRYPKADFLLCSIQFRSISVFFFVTFDRLCFFFCVRGEVRGPIKWVRREMERY